MNKLMCTLWTALVFSGCLHAQEEMNDLEAIISKSESKGKTVFTIKWSENLKDSLEKPTLDRFTLFWQNYSKQQYYKCYEFYSAFFKENTDLDSFMNKKRMQVKSINVKSVYSEKGSCAILNLTYHGVGGMFDMPDIKMKQRWIVENGEWVVFSDPFTEMESMGFSPPGAKAKKPVFPCQEQKPEKAGPVSPTRDKQ